MSSLATLTDIADALAGAGYTTETGELAGHAAVLAEDPHAAIGCIELDEWTQDLEEQISDAQASLTRWASRAGATRSWDVYLFVHLTVHPPDEAGLRTVERIEADTREARKLLRVAVPSKVRDLERALLPLLPLRTTAALDLGDPFARLREELTDMDIEPRVAEGAIASFLQSEEVEVS